MNKTLHRTQDDKLIAGVCSGIARYLGTDPNLVRLLMAVFTLLGGAGVACYAIGWLVIPEEGRDTSILQDLVNRPQQTR